MKLPPLPVRSCIVTHMGDGKGLHYSLGVAAGAALIEQPPGSQIDLFTADQLRARDLQVARAALEEAAKVAETSHPHDWAFISAAIRAIEVKHD